jgi:hypothetical protein
VVQEVAWELLAAVGDSCTVTQAEMEHALEKIPSVLTLPAETLAQRIFLLADKLECKPGELLWHYTRQPSAERALACATSTLLRRVDELLAWAGPDNRQLVLRAASVNPEMLKRYASGCRCKWGAGDALLV